MLSSHAAPTGAIKQCYISHLITRNSFSYPDFMPSALVLETPKAFSDNRCTNSFRFLGRYWLWVLHTAVRLLVCS